MTIRQPIIAALAFAVPLALTGCGGERVKVETIEVKEDTALVRAKHVLENYQKGQPLGSEASTFDQLVREVKAEDAAKGEILEKGLADIKAAKGQTAVMAKAKEILYKLGYGRSP